MNSPKITPAQIEIIKPEWDAMLEFLNQPPKINNYSPPAPEQREAKIKRWAKMLIDNNSKETIQARREKFAGELEQDDYTKDREAACVLALSLYPS